MWQRVFANAGAAKSHIKACTGPWSCGECGEFTRKGYRKAGPGGPATLCVPCGKSFAATPGAEQQPVDPLQQQHTGGSFNSAVPGILNDMPLPDAGVSLSEGGDFDLMALLSDDAEGTNSAGGASAAALFGDVAELFVPTDDLGALHQPALGEASKPAEDAAALASDSEERTDIGSDSEEEDGAEDVTLRMLPLWGDIHNDSCEKCNRPGSLLCCSFCNLAFHIRCIKSLAGQPPPKGEWACGACAREACAMSAAHRSLVKILREHDITIETIASEAGISERSLSLWLKQTRGTSAGYAVGSAVESWLADLDSDDWGSESGSDDEVLGSSEDEDLDSSEDEDDAAGTASADEQGAAGSEEPGNDAGARSYYGVRQQWEASYFSDGLIPASSMVFAHM